MTFIAESTDSLLVIVFFFVSCGCVTAAWLLLLLGIHFAGGRSVPSPIVGALRAFISVYAQIMYIEILEFFVGMFNCQGNVLDMTVDLNSKILCWDTLHVVYVCLASVFIILHVAFAVIVVNLDFEMKMKTKNSTARSSNMLCNWELFQYTCMVLSIALLGYSSNKSIALIFFVLSSGKLIICVLLEPYHCQTVQKVSLVFYGVETWASAVLSYALYFDWMSGSISAAIAILGAPAFAFMALCTWRERNRDLLKLKTKKCKPYDMYLKMRKMIEVFDNPEEIENSIWLHGHLSKHLQRCKKENCVFHEDFRNILKLDVPTSLCIKSYYVYLNAKYKKLVRSDPANSFLRITYAVFLSEYVKSRVNALLQLEEAQSLQPSLAEEMQLCRYRSLFEGELAEEKMLVNKMTQSNIELAVRYEALRVRFKETLKESASAFVELWNYVKSETPDSQQLELLIQKAYEQGTVAEALWEEIITMKGDIPKTLYLYAHYQLNIMNDRKTADLLMHKAKTEENIQTQAHQDNELTLKDMRNINEYASDGTPCVYISCLTVCLYFI